MLLASPVETLSLILINNSSCRLRWARIPLIIVCVYIYIYIYGIGCSPSCIGDHVYIFYRFWPNIIFIYLSIIGFRYFHLSQCLNRRVFIVGYAEIIYSFNVNEEPALIQMKPILRQLLYSQYAVCIVLLIRTQSRRANISFGNKSTDNITRV